MTSVESKPLIAIVDDDASVCRALRRLVRTRGIDAATFACGRDFLDALRTAPSFAPRCVIIDMHMPGLNGLEVLRLLGAVAPHIPVVFLTAHDRAGNRQQALAAGAAAFFEKPLIDGTFVDTLLALITPTSGSA